MPSPQPLLVGLHASNTTLVGGNSQPMATTSNDQQSSTTSVSDKDGGSVVNSSAIKAMPNGLPAYGVIGREGTGLQMRSPKADGSRYSMVWVCV